MNAHTRHPTRSLDLHAWLAPWILPTLLLGCNPAAEDAESSAPCLKDTDCKGDRLCLAGQCTPPGEEPAGTDSTGSEPATPCTKDTDCKGDRLCIDGFCEAPQGGDAGPACFEIAGQTVCTQTQDPAEDMGGMTSGSVPPPAGPLPSSAGLNLKGFTVPNQGSCGSCVAFAVRSAMGLRSTAQLSYFTDFSPAHIWHIAGYGASDCDEGSNIGVVVGASDKSELSVVPMSVWPYDPANPEASLDAVPAADILADKGIAYIDKFVSVSSMSALEVKYAIAQGWPAVLSVPVHYDDWKDGDIDVPDGGTKPNGYHAVTLVGYDDATSRFRFVNSWGTGFGDAGYGTMTYAFIDAKSGGGVAIQALKLSDVSVCGDGTCDDGETQSNCCTDCGCPGGQGCEAGICVENSFCGNGTIDAGEECDGSALGGASCGSAGFDAGNIGCKPDCTLNTSGCCDDECAGGNICLDANTVGSCGNYDADVCLDLGNSVSCSDGQSCSGGVCACAGGEFQLLSEVYPSFGAPGCSGDGSLKLKASAELISPTKLRIHVRKADDTAFGAAATLSLYVGEPIQCPNPPNIVKATKAVVVGQVDQTIDLTVSPYNGTWNVGETKKFWVGKDEGGFSSFRATGLVSIKRNCAP